MWYPESFEHPHDQRRLSHALRVPEADAVRWLGRWGEREEDFLKCLKPYRRTGYEEAARRRGSHRRSAESRAAVLCDFSLALAEGGNPKCTWVITCPLRERRKGLDGLWFPLAFARRKHVVIGPKSGPLKILLPSNIQTVKGSQNLGHCQIECTIQYELFLFQYFQSSIQKRKTNLVNIRF